MNIDIANPKITTTSVNSGATSGSKTVPEDSPKFSEELNALSKKDFIERTVDPLDKRKIRVFITDKGRHFASERKKEVESYFQMLLEHFGEEDTQEYLRLSSKMNQLIKQLKSGI